MKKLILICGANGVGKSTASKALLDSLPRSAYIDSEYCCAINPFQLTAETIQLFKSNIAALMVNAFRCEEIDTVIFPYSFHGQRQEIFQHVQDELHRQNVSYEWCPVILECELQENIARMRKDQRDAARIERAITHSRSVYDHLDYPRIDTTGLSVSETIDAIKGITGC